MHLPGTSWPSSLPFNFKFLIRFRWYNITTKFEDGSDVVKDLRFEDKDKDLKSKDKDL